MAEHKYGHRREDGWYFHGKRKDGSQQWYSPDAWHRMRIGQALRNAKARASDKKLSFDLTPYYLLSIFPPDGLCPALRIPLVWGGNCFNSPALDRINNNKGYVCGNVQWLSHRANTLKSDATPEEMERVLNYIRKNLN